MIKKFFIALFFSSCVQAAPITWIAQSPANNMNDPANWNPNMVPGNTDVAEFDSSVPGIATNPTEFTAPFSVSSINFLNLAAPFSFKFDNQTLAFSGAGITGAQTDATFLLVNLGNTTPLGDVISFAAAGTTGSADITTANNVTLTGAQSGQTIGIIDSHLHAVGAFSIADGGAIAALNGGNDSATALGGNTIAVNTASQIQCDSSCTSGDNVTLFVVNTGIFSGSNSVTGDSVGTIGAHQVSVTGAFAAGDSFSCTVENAGINSNTGIGDSKIGVINAAQMALQSTGVVGNDGSIIVTNLGGNDAANTLLHDQVAYLNDYQFFVGESLQAGDRFRLTVSNSGGDGSTGVGNNQVSVINSNSGTTGDQVLLLQGGAFGNNAALSVANSGQYSGTNTVAGSQVAGMNQGQCTVGDSTLIGSFNFSAANNFDMAVSNSGLDSGVGIGGDVVGTISTNQVTFFTPCFLGNQAQIAIANEGIYSGTASTNFVNVGSTGGGQLHAHSSFQAGDDFALRVANLGENTGSGVGNFFVGDLITGQQVNFEEGVTMGDNGFLTIANGGSNSSTTAAQNQVGSLLGYGFQLRANGEFNAGDNLQVAIANSGFENSSGSGGNLVGFINNNTADGSASQLHLTDGGTVGNNATIALVNEGTLQSTNGGNLTAVLAGSQWASVTAFEAGDQFNLDVSNNGINSALGQNNNSTAVSAGSQVDLRSDCTVGDNASFVVSNSGTNQDATGTNNAVGVIASAQLRVAGDFFAGTDLTIAVTNSAVNTGDGTNVVGSIGQSQLAFEQACALQGGSTITVENSGTVGASQILFDQGFAISNGKVTIQAANEGSVANHGIEINGSNAGGNADIVLSNTSLYIATSLPNFTIASLTGDGTSVAQSKPTLIINQNGNPTNFAGVIQDFSGIVPTVLVKTGAGTQILSGINTYTGLTTVDEGILVVNGVIAGDLNIDPAGTLKGTGTINGTVTNAGTIAPGQSIGTITVGNYINNGGTYEVELNGTGKSDLINVIGTATLNGGKVVVIPLGFNFTRPRTYTIITTGAGVTGRFSALSSPVPSLMRLIYTPFTVQLGYVPLTVLCSCNARNAANCFITLAGPDVDRITDALLTLNGPDFQNAFERMSPAQFSGPTEVQLLDAILVRSTYTKHMQKFLFDACDREKVMSFWFDGIAQWQHQGDPFGYNDTTLGASFGIDYQLCDAWMVGAAFSTTYDQFQGKEAVNKATLNGYYAGIYSRWQRDHVYLNTAFLGALTHYKTARNLSFGTIDRCACATHDGNEWLIHAGLAYEAWQTSLCHLLPYINLDYVVQHEDGYTETGAGSLNLKVRKKNAMLFQGEAGISLSKEYETPCGIFTPLLTLAYINQTPCSNKNYRANFVNSACCFTGRGGDYERNLFAPRLALTYHDACDDINISLHYDAQVGSKKYWAQDIAFDLTLRF